MSNDNMAQKDEGGEDTSSSPLTDVINDIVFNPLNLILLVVCLFLLYKIFSSRRQEEVEETPRTPEIPPMKKHDMTHQELRNYDGNNEEGRVCVAVNGKVFDVTKGKRFYGPDGPYASFAGRDASRCLGTFSVEGATDEYDDLSDLSPGQMDKIKEWEIQFQERYHYVGRLLRPGEDPTDYSDEEEAGQDQNPPENEDQKPPVNEDQNPPENEDQNPPENEDQNPPENQPPSKKDD